MLFEKGSFLRQNGQRVEAGGMSYGGREEGASVNHCYCVWELNVITFFVSFVYLHPSVAIYGRLAEEISNVETCSNLQIVVIRLSEAQHPLSSAQLCPVRGELGGAEWLVFALGAFPHGGQTSGMQPAKLH